MEKCADVVTAAATLFHFIEQLSLERKVSWCKKKVQKIFLGKKVKL